VPIAIEAGEDVGAGIAPLFQGYIVTLICLCLLRPPVAALFAQLGVPIAIEARESALDGAIRFQAGIAHLIFRLRLSRPGGPSSIARCHT
jgi:hypothetical protein